MEPLNSLSNNYLIALLPRQVLAVEINRILIDFQRKFFFPLVAKQLNETALRKPRQTNAKRQIKKKGTDKTLQYFS